MTKPNLWNAAAIAAATQGKLTGDFTVTGVSIDSRSLEHGDLFVALQGPSFDGNDFAAAALQRGAAGALIHRRAQDLPARAPVIEVADTMRALEDLGRAARARTGAKIVAVTGSVGKTSSKEALRAVLSLFGATYASVGNLNNQWGAPLSLSRMPQDSRFGVFELGMNHAGEISPLSQMVRPHVAVITTVEPVHIEFFDSVEGIADAKAEIFDGLLPGGAAVLPFDNAHFTRLEDKARRMGARILSFGTNDGGSGGPWARLIECQVTPQGTQVTAEIGGKRLRYRIAALGAHQALNSVAVLAAAFALDLDLDHALPGFGAFEALKGRGKREALQIQGGEIELIDEGYNASPPRCARPCVCWVNFRPPSVAAASWCWATCGNWASAARSCIANWRRTFPPPRSTRPSWVGPLMQGLYELLPSAMRAGHKPNSDAMVETLVAAIRPGDTVLIKGSLGTRMAPLVEAVRALDKTATKIAANGH